MEWVIKTDKLTKKYGKQTALDEFNIHVKKGDVHALIGPNGSGKTTLVRILMGTSWATSGSFSLFGVEDPKRISEERKKIGTLIETPKFYDMKSAYDNLDLICEMRGIKDKSVINNVLNSVGLSGVGGKHVGKYSLGMKQRLGLAKAIIHKPELLILDEPINGLDPAGVAEIRKMIISFRESGITVVIASHILKELTEVANHYTIIKNGRVYDDFSADELSKKCNKWIEITTENSDIALNILRGEFKNIESVDGLLRIYDCSMDMDKVIKILSNNNISIRGCIEKTSDLESYYLNITKE